MLHSLDKIVAQRYWAWIICAILAAACLGLMSLSSFWLWPALVFGALTLVGMVDFLQTRQAIRRNYPVLAHFRFFFEYIRPEIRQYFIEADSDELPFSRAQRSVIYQRSKQAADKRPFGTQLNVYEPHYEWINHSIAPAHIEDHDFRIDIGSAGCTRPYSASVFNISAMSFGSLTCERHPGAQRRAPSAATFFTIPARASISPYHRENGGDLVWEIGSGYFGCRDARRPFQPGEVCRKGAPTR